jgi:hypothetical protein
MAAPARRQATERIVHLVLSVMSSGQKRVKKSRSSGQFQDILGGEGSYFGRCDISIAPVYVTRRQCREVTGVISINIIENNDLIECASTPDTGIAFRRCA